MYINQFSMVVFKRQHYVFHIFTGYTFVRQFPVLQIQRPREFMFTPPTPTRGNSTVASRRRCVLGLSRMTFSRYIWYPVLGVWLGGVAAGRRIRDREVASSIPGCFAAKCNSGQVVHTRAMCICSPSSINWYRLRLGVKCTTGAALGMLAAIRRTLRLAANRRHSSIVLTCGCRCTAALKWLLSVTLLYKLSLLYLYFICANIFRVRLTRRWPAAPTCQFIVPLFSRDPDVKERTKKQTNKHVW